MPEKAQHRQKQEACFVVCKLFNQLGIWAWCVCKGGARGGYGCKYQCLAKGWFFCTWKQQRQRGNTSKCMSKYQVPAWEG